MKASNLRATTSRVPNILTKREKQAIDFITACGYDVNAFSNSLPRDRCRSPHLQTDQPTDFK